MFEQVDQALINSAVMKVLSKYYDQSKDDERVLPWLSFKK